MLHPSQNRVKTPAQAARAARRELAALSRPAGRFDASRYFRNAGTLGFYNVGADRVRAMAKATVQRHKEAWSVADVARFADLLVRDRHLEVKGLGIEAMACYRRRFTPSLLRLWKRWLSRGDAANWATTDAICGLLIGPLLVEHPHLASTVAKWAGDRNMWVRRASIVGLIPLARRGLALDLLYPTARRLHRDEEDLIQKAVGWALREAGKTDMNRLERYLRAAGARIPRTTLRYAIERFPPVRRRQLLMATRAAGSKG
jgi:3-methyladenine DNA glycosylase AlkD